MANFYYDNNNQLASNLFLEKVPEQLSDNLKKVHQLLLMRAKAFEDETIDQLYSNYSSTYGFAMNDYLSDIYFLSKTGSELDSTAYLHLGTDNAFHVDGVLAAAEYFKNDPDPFKSYNIIVDALHYNQNSSRLLHAYIIQAVSLGFVEYAEDALYQYSQRFPGQGFNKLVKEYETAKEQLEKLVEPED